MKEVFYPMRKEVASLSLNVETSDVIKGQTRLMDPRDLRDRLIGLGNVQLEHLTSVRVADDRPSFIFEFTNNLH